jgi:hypothetical protein
MSYVPGQIDVYNGMDAQIVYSSLEDYREKMLNDQRTKYNNDPRWCQEDVDFLDDAIGRIYLLLKALKQRHPKIVTKG